jgi:RNA polymerase sigma-70 factor (ECF subfamily)
MRPASDALPLPGPLPLRGGHDPHGEAELLAALRTGDPAAEWQFYRQHVDRVYRLILRMCGRPELAQEWTQDAFLRAFDRLAQFRGDAALGSWLRAIAVSVTLNGLKTLRRREAFAAPLDDAHDLPQHAATADPDLPAALRLAIAALPPQARRVFVLHDVEGFTHEQIAELLGIAAGTSKSQLSRARAQLREALAPFAPSAPTLPAPPETP